MARTKCAITATDPSCSVESCSHSLSDPRQVNTFIRRFNNVSASGVQPCLQGSSGLSFLPLNAPLMWAGTLHHASCQMTMMSSVAVKMCYLMIIMSKKSWHVLMMKVPVVHRCRAQAWITDSMLILINSKQTRASEATDKPGELLKIDRQTKLPSRP